jgi:2-polyprenyl-3-methyl-5-hydroxy-6-metoxy-1,4-benzoquinol methylase
MSVLRDLRDAIVHLRRGDVRAALDELALPLRAEQLRTGGQKLARRTWMKYAMRGVAQADAHGRLELAYQLADPWHMDSDLERHRFMETNRIIEAELETWFGTILEIGCGEGHQSRHLAHLTDHLTGIDVSPTAIERARKRVPAAQLIAGDLYQQPWVDERGRYDLVTACEVLYYMSDIPRCLRAMDRLGATCLVTYFAPAARRVEAHILAMPGVERTTLRYADTEWVAAWWRGELHR